MYVKIQMLLEDDEGIHIQGLIPKPERGEVPALGVLAGKDEGSREDQLHRRTEAIRAVNKMYSEALAAYTRLHLGDANLVQEEED